VLPEHPGASGLFNCKGCGAEIEASTLAPVPVAAVEPPGPKEQPAANARKMGPRPVALEVTELPGAMRLRWKLPHTGIDTLVGGLALAFLGLVLLYAMSDDRYIWVMRASIASCGAGLGVGVWRQGKPRLATVTMRKDSFVSDRFPFTRLDPARLSQAYVKEVTHRQTYDDEDGRQQERFWYTYDVRARLTDGDHVTLIEDAGSVELALHLEREIEKYYRITDKRVVYELPRE
jgi:hypothetical protein